MGEHTAISWTNHTFNPWIGCTKVSPGCANCYAEKQNERHKWTCGWGPGEERHITSASSWNAIAKWAKTARATGKREKVFCASLADIFDHEAPVFARRALWHLLTLTSDALDFQIVTKRPQRIEQVMKEDDLAHDFFLAHNVWLIASTENQEWFDKRVPYLLRVPAAVHGVSAEPLLGAIDGSKYLRKTLCQVCNGTASVPVEGNGDTPCPACLNSNNGRGNAPSLNWVIVGGESQVGARPMPPDAARRVRDQCVEYGVAFFFFKQHGEFVEVAGNDVVDADKQRPPIDSRNRVVSIDGHIPAAPDEMRPNIKYRWVTWIGTKNAGSTSDGQEWKQFPRVA